MARITRSDVERVAALARLSLDPAEAERMTSELDVVLEYAQLLQEVDTSGVEATSHAVPLPTPMRADVPLPPVDPELALANAPERQDSAFVVPRVIGDEDAG
jgi:aspartyl-tRNA(Asn)/glutamyl-tRNA(Gln) amidotransferase subunit C